MMVTTDLATALAQQLQRESHGAPVERIDTHISSVLLAGADAFKLKKPLRLPFLDFTTLAARRHFCAEELRINRRTAPQLYVARLPVLGPPDAPRLGRADDAADAALAIDWAVQMRRFDPEQGLDRLAARGELDAALIDQLAQAMDAFHAALPAPPAGQAAPGDPDTVWRWAADNLRSLAELAGPGCARHWQADIHRLQEWSTHRFATLRPLMAERHRTGRVRECHGDLHLGNWVRLGGVPVAFDAIEFNAELRWIDPVSDLAFPFMDLLAHGRHDLAWRLVNGWFELSGDYAGVPLLGWFAVYRALVRAKVALIEAAQAPAGSSAAPLARAEAHLQLALRLAAQGGGLGGGLDSEPASTPLLIALGGLSGSGKSTVAQCCVEQLGALRLRSDVERKRLFGMRPRQRPGQAGAPGTELLYSTAATEATYARLFALSRALLGAGLSVVFDAASLRRSERDTRRRLAHDCGARHLLLHCSAPPAVLAARVAARAQRDDDASDADVTVLARQQGFEEALDPAELADTLPIDTDRPLAQLCAEVGLLLRTMLAAPAGPDEISFRSGRTGREPA
jgi:aminoglycoside phosphotransferase family enzyme/predicted kinase